ncbi:MAG: tetratricopeptide repeat protein, partial [Wenzhouxiangella sp.]
RAAAGFYNHALDAAEQAAELLAGHGGRAEAWARARLFALSGEIGRAIQQFGQLVEQYPGDSDARLALTELLAGNGQLDEAIRVIREVTAASPNHPRAWFLLGKFAVMSGDPQRAAEDYFVKALVIQNRLGDTEGRAEVLNGLGIAHEHLGQLDAAIRYYGEAANLRSQAGDRRGHAASLSNMGRLHMIHGSYQPARDAINQALSIREEIGDLDGMARTYNHLGVLEEEVGNYDAARAHYGNALRAHEQLGGSLVAAEVRTSLAFIHMLLGEYDTAEAFVRNAIEEQTAAGNSKGLMAGLQISGELDIIRGRWDQAQASLLRALEIARKLGNPFGEATVHGSIGLLAAYQGRIAAAMDAFDTAISLLEPLGDRRGLAEYHLRTAEMLESLELSEHARSSWQQARDFFADQANLSQHARLLRLEAVLAAGQENPAAESIFDEALQLARASGNRPVAMEIRISRLQHMNGTLADFEQLADDAERLGHQAILLRSLALLADKQLDSGNVSQAQQTVSRTLRPPLALDPWTGNWRLHAIRERIESQDAPTHSSELFMELAAQLPPDLQKTFRQQHGL